MRGIIIAVWLWSFAAVAWGQPNKYWIYLTDKDTANYHYQEQLSQAAIQRRQLQEIRLQQYTDVPVNTSYLKVLETYGITPVSQSKWLNAVSAYLSTEQLQQVQKLSFVQKVQRLDSRWHIASSFAQPFLVDEIYTTAIAQLEGKQLKKAGLDGTGITIGVIDAGYYKANQNDYLQELFKHQRILGIKDFVNPLKGDHFDKAETSNDTHGTQVLEFISGKVEDEIQIGLATGAQFYLARTDHGYAEFRGEEDYWISAMEWMDSLGVSLINTSLGYALGFDDPSENYSPLDMNGNTSAISKAATIAANDKGILLVVSAGNEGESADWRIISTPADAKGVLAVGATNYQGMKAGYSSIGPDFLSYIKPNVSCYSLGGTSFSAPVITGFAACLWQQNPEIKSHELYEIIQQSSTLYPYGNNYIGFGIPKASKALALMQKNKVASSVQVLMSNNKTVKIKLDTKKDQHAVVFHKKDQRIVQRQELISVKKGEVKIKKPRSSAIKYSTIVLPGSSYEVHWQ
ncbi:S8 family serine peptidase [Rapidithrix thailandica]|uniref:S8 family serine peptidase n=1 Tax=Rapidithrix thailandica TaxID=413964 RepID=A0AAW9S6V1_9BACT